MRKKKEDDTEERLNRTYQLGQSEGLSYAASILLSEASQYFERGLDEPARMLRKISEEIRDKAKEKRPAAPPELDRP